MDLATIKAVSPLEFCLFISSPYSSFPCCSGVIIRVAAGFSSTERGKDTSRNKWTYRVAETETNRYTGTQGPTRRRRRRDTDVQTHTKMRRTMPVESRFTASMSREFPPFSSEKHAFN